MPRKTHRKWYELRVREETSPSRWVKKSRFYSENGPKEARGHYTKDGHVMSSQKVSIERLLGIGDFFKLGPQLLAELGEEPKEARQEKYFGKRRKEFNKEF